MSMPAMSQNLLRILSRRLRNSTSHLRAIAALDVNGRIIQQMLAFADRYGSSSRDGQVLIPIRLTQNDLAGLVGASRKRVNQAMVILKRCGWIAIDGSFHITIKDRAALEKLLGRNL